MAKGTEYEILSKEIYETILNQSDLKNVEVKHNVILSGKTTSHQIDIYWEFELSGVLYKTIVQTKDWNKPIDKGELLKFAEVLKDLPGQPRGIFITTNGYQKGAREVAISNGIDIMVLEELKSEPVSLVEFGYAQIHLKKSQIPIVGKNKQGSIFILEFTAYEPKIEKYEIEFDYHWLEQKTDKGKNDLKNEISMHNFPKFTPKDLKFYNELGDQVGYFGEIYKIYLEELRKTDKYEGRMSHHFVAPTFIDFEIFNQKIVKILSISTNITIIKSPMKKLNFQLPNFIQFVLKNIKNNTSIIVGKNK